MPIYTQYILRCKGKSADRRNADKAVVELRVFPLPPKAVSVAFKLGFKLHFFQNKAQCLKIEFHIFCLPFQVELSLVHLRAQSILRQP